MPVFKARFYFLLYIYIPREKVQLLISMLERLLEIARFWLNPNLTDLSIQHWWCQNNSPKSIWPHFWIHVLAISDFHKIVSKGLFDRPGCSEFLPIKRVVI